MSNNPAQWVQLRLSAGNSRGLRVCTLCGEGGCRIFPGSQCYMCAHALSDFSSPSSRPSACLACLQHDSYFMGFNFLEVAGKVTHVVHLEHWGSASKLASVVSLPSGEAKQRGLFSFFFPRNVHLQSTERTRAASNATACSRCWRRNLGGRQWAFGLQSPFRASSHPPRPQLVLAGEQRSEAATTGTGVRNRQRKERRARAMLTRS